MEYTKEQLEKRIEEAIELSSEAMVTDGDHHKMWFIDQIVRVLTGDKYQETLEKLKKKYPEGYLWDEGIQP